MSIHSSIKIYASPNAVWSIWKNVDQWNVWDSDVQWSQLDGEFCKGTTGTLKPKRGPVTLFIISHCVPFESFTTQSSLPLCRLIFIHSITQDVHFVTVTHSVEFSGISSFIFSRLIGRAIQKGMPPVLTQLKKYSEAL